MPPSLEKGTASVPTVLLVEAFAALRTARVALEPLQGSYKIVHVACESQQWLNRLASKNWPEEICCPDIRMLNFKWLQDVLNTCPQPQLVLLVGGLPCEDVSRLKCDRRNLAGSQSSLFYQFLYLRDRLTSLVCCLFEFVIECTQVDQDALEMVCPAP